MRKGEIMPNHKELITDIVDMEWEMFAAVENQGGKASCQSRPDTFEIMRVSQLETWSEEIRQSYLSDLKRAKAQGRNLCSEKYGYMMESTAPSEYRKIKKYLPETDPDVMFMIRKIVAVNLAWEEQVDQAYPRLRANGRPLRKEQDTPYFTSVETYLTGELRTYSKQTIQQLYEYTLRCDEEGENLALKNLENIVHAYGYATLQDAEAFQ